MFIGYSKTKNENNFFLTTLFLSLLSISCAFLLYQRIYILEKFQIFDEDQTILWIAAKELLKGNWREPCFYGQNYNTYIESLVAIPFLNLNFNLPFSLSLASFLLAMLPFYIIGITGLLKKKFTFAAIAICYPLLLPTSYQMITSMPRGFVTSIPLATFSFALATMNCSLFSLLISGLTLSLSIAINPNAAIIALPIFVLIFIELPTSQRNFFFPYNRLFFLLGILAGAGIKFLMWLFYFLHPNYIIYPEPAIDFSFDLIKIGIFRIPEFWQDVIPFFIDPQYFLLGILVTPFLFLLLRVWGAFFATILSITFLILTLGISRVHGGFTGVWLPLARMYLALPILCLLFLYKVPRLKSGVLSEKISPLLGMIAAVISFYLFAYNFSKIDESIKDTLNRPYEAVIPQPLTNIFSMCERIKSVSQQTGSDILIAPDGMARVYWYGCAALLDQQVKIIHPGFERRTWLLIEESLSKRTKVLVRDIDLIKTKTLINEKEMPLSITPVSGHEDFFLITSTIPLTSIEISKQIGLDVRQF